MKKTLFVLLILCLLTVFVYGCEETTEEMPIFSDGVYDGYYYLPDNWGGDSNIAYATPPLPEPDYKFLLGVRNEKNQCEFSNEDDAYINASLGFYKERGCEKLPFDDEPNELVVKLYVINHISDVIDYSERKTPKNQDFSQLTPVEEISDFYNSQEKTLNTEYGCFANKTNGRKFVDYSHHTRLTIPNDIFYFDKGYITVAAVFFFQFTDEEYIRNSDTVFHAKISYQKKDGKITYTNFEEIPQAVLPHHEHPVEKSGFFDSIFGKKEDPAVDNLGYEGDNMLITIGNVHSAKIGDAYFASYFLKQPNKSFLPKYYLVKIQDTVYYKNDLYQTYWKPVECDTFHPFYKKENISGVVDPEEVFMYMLSFRIEEYTDFMNDYGLSDIEAEKTFFSNNDGHLTFLMKITEDRKNRITYYGDGWIKSIHIEDEKYGDMWPLNIRYYLDVEWDAVRINPSYIQLVE